MAPPPLPPGVPPEMAWFASWISEQFGKIEGKLESLAKEFITRREFERLQVDIDRAHAKIREFEQGPFDELEDRVSQVETHVHKIEIKNEGEHNVAKAQWTTAEKMAGVIFVLVQIAITLFLGLR